MAGAVAHGVGSGTIRDEQRDMVKRAVVHIDTKDPKLGRGSGFIADFPVSRVLKKAVLMTCNHVLPSLEAAQKSIIYFGRSSGNNPGTMIEGHELFDDQYYLTDNESFFGWGRRFDYTVVEVKMDVLQKYLMDEVPEPLSLTKCAEMMECEGLCLGNTVYIVHYPAKGGTFDRHDNAGQICNIEGPCIGHMATTSGGSGGSPLLREYNNELIVIGLHRGELRVDSYTHIKVATLITAIVADVQTMYHDDNDIPKVGTFAQEARRYAMELKHPTLKQPPPIEEEIDSKEKKESSEERATPDFRVKRVGGQRDVLAMKVHGFKTKDNQTHHVILRKHVSQEAIDSGRALLAALGLRKPQIAKWYDDNPGNEEEAVQAGLEDWVRGVDPTWGDLLKAMETAAIKMQACNELQEELLQSGDFVLDVKVHGFRTKDGANHLVILRQYVSRKATNQKTALLEVLDFTSAQIAQHSKANPGSEEEAIQAGLVAWINRVHPTWGQLLKNMETAGIGRPVCSELREMLYQQQVSCDN